MATEQIAAAPVERAAVWEDFIDIFFAPSAVFARRERGSVWPPLLILTLLFAVLFYVNLGVLQPAFDGDFDRAMARALSANPRLTPEMVERFRVFGQRFAVIGAVVFVPLATVLVGAVVWLVGKLFGAVQTFRAALIVAAYSYTPKIIELLVSGLQGLLLDPAQMTGHLSLSLGVGRFLDPDVTSPLVLAIVGRIDLFTIWVTVLLAIGLSVTGRIPRSRAFLAAPLIWIAGGLPQIFQSLR